MLVGVTLAGFWSGVFLANLPYALWYTWLGPFHLFALLLPVAGWFWARPGSFAPLALLYAMFAMPLLFVWLAIMVAAISGALSGSVAIALSGFVWLFALAGCTFGG